MQAMLGERRVTAEADPQRWYALCGTRMYAIGTLAGTFPDTGWHQPGEMGGLWAPPIKLLDGYWLGLRTPGQPPTWLTAPTEWHLSADGVRWRYELPALGLRVERREWLIPEESVLVVEVLLSALRPEAGPVHPGLECGLVARSDLHGAWLAEERLGWQDGQDHAAFDDALGAILITDEVQPSWAVCLGAAEPPSDVALGTHVWGPERTAGKGSGAALWYRYGAPATGERRLRFVLTGGVAGAEHARATFRHYAAPLADGSTALAAAQRDAVAAFNKPFEAARLESPDQHLNTVFGWAKANCAWLLLDVPGLGRAPMGGLPDFPWWFGCDTAYSVLPLLTAGYGADAAAALRTIAQLSRRTNGSAAVVHEVVSNGAVHWKGNLVEIPLFARAVYHTYRWTGDRLLLEDLFPFCLEGLLDVALGEHLQPGEIVPQGASIVETPEMHGGVQTLDNAAYLMEALDLLAELAEDLHQPTVALDLRQRALALREHLRHDWWLPAEGLFGDVRASREELAALLARLEAAQDADEWAQRSIERLRTALASEPQPGERADARRPWSFSHYLPALAAEAGVPTPEQATRLLTALESPEWTEQYGLVLNAASDRRVMTLPTGALALAEARYGRVERSLDYIQRIASTFGMAMPAAMAEYSPDGGCFLQCWSAYGVVWPVVHHLFGLRPDVAARRLLCMPQVPATWGSVALRAVPVGATQVDVELHTEADGLRIVLAIGDPGWEVTLGAVLPAGARLRDCAPPGARATMQETAEGLHVLLFPPRTGISVHELRVTWEVAPNAAAARPPAGSAGAQAQ